MKWDGFDFTPDDDVLKGLELVRQSGMANMLDGRGVMAAANSLFDDAFDVDSNNSLTLAAACSWIADLYYLGLPKDLRTKLYAETLKKLGEAKTS